MLRNLTASLLALGVAAAVSAQGPCFDVSLGTDLALADDAVSAVLPLGFTFTYNGVAYTDISVCSNGYVWFGAVAGAADWSPTQAELLAQGARFAPLWQDFNPAATGSGHVFYDNSTPGVARITWNGVFTYGTTLPTTMQVVFDASNTITVTYGSIGPSSTFQGGTTIIGASPGAGAVANPVSFAALPLVVGSDNFAEVIATPTGTSAPYANNKWVFTPTGPGYIVSDVTCTPNSMPAMASSQAVGLGCPSRSGPSLYEVFNANNLVDLSGRDLTYLPTGPQDYIALPGISPTWFAGFSNSLGLTDDSVTPVLLPFAFPYNGASESTIQVSSNGFLTIGTFSPGNGCCSGNVAAMLTGPGRVSGYWEDLNPSAGGAVFADLDPNTGDFVVTWNAVPEYGTTNINTFQIALSPTGQITQRWLSVTGANGPYLVGYSRGGNSLDNGATDLSAVSAASITSAIVEPLALAAGANSRPQVGGTFTVNATGIQSLPNGVFCAMLISTEIPGGFPLDTLGLSGCNAYIVLPELVSFLNLSLGSPSSSFAISIPMDPAFYGISLMSQAVSDDLAANALGFRVSNGLRWNFGL